MFTVELHAPDVHRPGGSLIERKDFEDFEATEEHLNTSEEWSFAALFQDGTLINVCQIEFEPMAGDAESESDEPVDIQIARLGVDVDNLDAGIQWADGLLTGDGLKFAIIVNGDRVCAAWTRDADGDRVMIALQP